MNVYSLSYKHPPMWEIVPGNLEAAMQKAGINQSQLAEAVGVKQPSIGRLLSGETKTTRALDRIAAALGTTAAFLKGEEEYRQVERALTARDPDAVELAELDLAFGLGATFLDLPVKAEKAKFSRRWLRGFTHTPPEHLFFARGLGDSMMPTILDSDTLLIDTADNVMKTGDQLWAISYCGLGMVKRLRRTKDGGVRIMSDNPHVSEDVAYDGELHLIGRVVAIVRKV